MENMDDSHQIFGIEVVLDSIFKTATSKDLKNYRAVNRAWRHSATKQLRKYYWTTRKFLNLLIREDLEDYLSVFPDLSAEANGSSNPQQQQIHSCYELDNSSSSYFLSRRLLRVKFLPELNQRIKTLSLTLNFDWNFSGDDFENILRGQADSLEEFRFTSTECLRHGFTNFEPTSTTGSDSSLFPDFQLNKLNYLCLYFNETSRRENSILEIVLRKVPEWKSLKICLQNWQELSSTIFVLKKYRRVQNLKVLELRRRIPGELAELASEGVQLEFFDVRDAFGYSWPIVPSNMLDLTRETYEFLCTQLRTLKTLKWGSGWLFRFPIRGMPAIRQLKLYCGRRQNQNGNIVHAILNVEEAAWISAHQPISYELEFPGLEELVLETSSGGRYAEPPSPEVFKLWFLTPLQQPHLGRSLKKLSTRCPRIDQELLTGISKNFPAVTSLKLQSFMKYRDAEDGLFPALWNIELADKLEELSLDFYSCPYTSSDSSIHQFQFDSFISGMSCDEIQYEMSKVRGHIHEGITDADIFMPAVGAPDSILNYTALKKLTLSGARSYRWSFTDFSAFCILGRMPNLKFFDYSKLHQNFTEAGMDYLDNKFAGDENDPSPPFLTAEQRVDQAFRVTFP